MPVLPDLSTLHEVMVAEVARGFAGVVQVSHGDDLLFSGAYGPASRRWPSASPCATC
ncbi:MAG TPA: hypothetical protein VFG72_10290 [Marmoricola sp.]|nr:hypothetical protein [Marmoricola sp.]